MAQRTPPSWLQNGSHPAENDRLTQQAAIGSSNGVIGASSYAVTAQGTPNMTVNIAPGYAVLVGASTSTQGSYVATNDATVVQTITAADTSNPRIDLIYLQVNDSAYSGSLNSVTLSYLTGVAQPIPVAPVPSGSATYYILAQIAVAANATSITTANITDLRLPAQSPLLQSNTQTLRLVNNQTAITGGTSVFGATNRPFLVSGRTYQITASIPITKIAVSGTAFFGFASSTASALTGALIAVDSGGTINGPVATAGTTNINFSASTSFTSSGSYLINIAGTITPTANTRINFNLASVGAGSVTVLAGAFLTVTDLGTSASIGNLG